MNLSVEYQKVTFPNLSSVEHYRIPSTTEPFEIHNLKQVVIKLRINCLLNVFCFLLKGKKIKS